ncbi:MAG: hypothetical protein WAL52_07790 [Candidatus Sulfotelmatobacter sp.]
MILPFVALALLALVTVYSAIVSFRKTEGVAPSWIFPNVAKRSAQIVVGILVLAPLIAFAIWLGFGARHESLRSSRFLIPEGYTGWVRVEFEVPGAPPLPMDHGEYTIEIPSGGILRTSSAEQYGWARDRYYYYSGQNARSLSDSGESAMIWGKLNGEAAGVSGKQKYEEFFVGTAQQFKDQGKEKHPSP